MVLICFINNLERQNRINGLQRNKSKDNSLIKDLSLAQKNINMPSNLQKCEPLLCFEFKFYFFAINFVKTILVD